MNTFGPSSSQQYPLHDLRETIQNRRRFFRTPIPVLEHVNSFYCPTGRWPFRGWILLRRGDYNKIDSYSTTLQLNIGNTSKPNNVSTLKNLCIVQAQCVSRGLASDPDALYLVEITDARGILWNKWFQFPVTASYNIRAPAYPQTDRGGTFHPNSMNTGVAVTTTWTWATMIQNLWELIGTSFLGTFPGVTITQDSTPEGFWLQGVSAWEALNDILAHLGLTIACDHTKDVATTNPFTIVKSGAVDTAFTALQTRYSDNLEDDLEWIDTGSARVPKTIKVLFRRRNEVYGTEETVRYDSFQWDMSPIYTVSITAPAAFSSAVGTHYIWSDFTVRYDIDNVPLPADTARAATIAQSEANDYYADIYDQTLGYMSQTYAGALPFVTGSRVDGVCWYMDYDYEQGWKTQIVRGPSPPWPGIWEEL